MRGLKLLILGVLAAGLAASKPVRDPLTVEMTPEMAFLPKALTASVGEIVVWKNVSPMVHSVNTVVDNCRSEDGKKWIKIPSGATAFFSGELKPGDEYRMRFEIPGTYQSLCTFHEDQMMRGTVYVRGASEK
jgi:plastocyanin